LAINRVRDPNWERVKAVFSVTRNLEVIPGALGYAAKVVPSPTAASTDYRHFMTAWALICPQSLRFPVPTLKAHDFNGNSNSKPSTIPMAR
jgi:hypothetical protein